MPHGNIPTSAQIIEPIGGTRRQRLSLIDTHPNIPVALSGLVLSTRYGAGDSGGFLRSLASQLNSGKQSPAECPAACVSATRPRVPSRDLKNP